MDQDININLNYCIGIILLYPNIISGIDVSLIASQSQCQYKESYTKEFITLCSR